MEQQTPSHNTLPLASPATARDMQIFVERLRSINSNAAVRLIARRKMAAVLGCTIEPVGLNDTTPMILGMRAFPLAATAQLDNTVGGFALEQELAEALADSATDIVELKIPQVSVNAMWAGVLPPLSGWEKAGEISSVLSREIGERAVREVQQALPVAPGQSLVQNIRAKIWGEPLNADYPEIPRGMAITALLLGVLPTQNTALPIMCHSDWTRLNTPAGYVLLGPKNSLGLIQK